MSFQGYLPTVYTPPSLSSTYSLNVRSLLSMPVPSLRDVINTPELTQQNTRSTTITRANTTTEYL
ncbi:6527_t:CDS:2 [Funneliformis geosporum]|nr:6527_t:CDS:2 [Funneliformis geosporum]